MLTPPGLSSLLPINEEPANGSVMYGEGPKVDVSVIVERPSGPDVVIKIAVITPPFGSLPVCKD